MSRRALTTVVLALCVGATNCERSRPQHVTTPPATRSAPSSTKPPVEGPTAPLAQAGDTAPLNSAGTMLLLAHNLEHVSIVHEDGGEFVAELEEAEVSTWRNALLVATSRQDMTLSAPRWPVHVLLRMRGQRVPFIATPHGFSRLRLNPAVPGSAAFAGPDGRLDPSVQEIDVGEVAFSALQRVIGDRIEQSKEYALDEDGEQLMQLLR